MGLEGPPPVTEAPPGFRLEVVNPSAPIDTPYFALRDEKGRPFFQAK
jgi:hypothetical protein